MANKGKLFTVDKSSLRRVQKKLQNDMQANIQRVIDTLAYIGEASVKYAREHGEYNDITGNLRSSIGYAVLYDGNTVIQGGLQQVHGRGENMSLVQYTTKTGKKVKYWAKGASGDGSQGVSEGEKLLEKLKAEYPKGAVLIVCAGMNYAAYVEAIHHKDVLTGAELRAEALAKKLLKGLTKTKL